MAKKMLEVSKECTKMSIYLKNAVIRWYGAGFKSLYLLIHFPVRRGDGVIYMGPTRAHGHTFILQLHTDTFS